MPSPFFSGHRRSVVEIGLDVTAGLFDELSPSARSSDTKSLFTGSHFRSEGHLSKAAANASCAYWTRTCAFLNHGLLHEDLFFETTGEFFAVWERVRPIIEEGRKQFVNPLFLATWKEPPTALRPGSRNEHGGTSRPCATGQNSYVSKRNKGRPETGSETAAPSQAVGRLAFWGEPLRSGDTVLLWGCQAMYRKTTSRVLAAQNAFRSH